MGFIYCIAQNMSLGNTSYADTKNIFEMLTKGPMTSNNP